MTTIHNPTQTDVLVEKDIVTHQTARRGLAVLRIAFGVTFLWAFVDKLFGLGFATPSSRAWINGGTPAQGFIKSIEGPFKDVFQVFATLKDPAPDWLPLQEGDARIDIVKKPLVWQWTHRLVEFVRLKLWI